MREAELLLLGLIVAVVGLSVLARVIRVPYPILLVLGGLVLGFVPGMPEVELAPELVLVVFLPPLLYWAGFFASPRELRADLRTISLLAAPLGPLCAGLLLTATSARATVAFFAVFTLALALWGTLSPSIRRAPSLAELDALAPA